MQKGHARHRCDDAKRIRWENRKERDGKDERRKEMDSNRQFKVSWRDSAVAWQSQKAGYTDGFSQEDTLLKSQVMLH